MATLVFEPLPSDNLTQVYQDASGPRGSKRISLTDNQKAVLWSLYQWEAYPCGHTDEYLAMKPRKRQKAILALYKKGLINDRHYVTDRGRSYVKRFRKC